MKNTLLEYFVTPEKTYLMIIRPEDGEPNVVEISEGEAYWKQARSEFYANLARVRPSKPQGFEDKIQGFYKLGSVLIEPALAYLKNTDLIYIVPHKDLHYLPFHGMKITVDGREIHVAEAFQVVCLPSASVLKFCQNKNPCRQGMGKITKPLVFGTWAENDTDAYKDAVRSELDLLSDLFQAGSIGKLDASKEHLLKEAPIADLLHLACHGYFIPSVDVMASSGLLLTNGKTFPRKPDKKHFLESVREESFLSAKEMLDIRLNCHLICLSACETGQSENRPGDELIGLSRALLYAGAPSILLALWPVNVESKMALMTSFYTHWKSNMREGKSKALQTARTEMLKSERFNSLYHWGAYFLIGDWL